MPRLSLILKSCFSSSNSEMEFFFIKSMIALMSFKSTEPPNLDIESGFELSSLSKKAVTDVRHCLNHTFLISARKSKEGVWRRQAAKILTLKRPKRHQNFK